MAFNLGAFAGGLAKGGMDTYSTLTDIEAKQQETEQRKEQFDAWRKEQAGKEALRSAVAEQGDMNNATPAAMMAGPAPQGLPQEGGYMTPEVAASEKLTRARQRALENGADPTAVMQYATAQRADTQAFNTDKAFEWMRGIDKTVTDKGLAKAAEEHLIPEYNKNKGTLNDGLTASLVTNKQGTFVEFKNKDGKVERTEPLNMKTFNMARDEVGASMLAAAGPEHFYKNREYGLKKEEVGAKTALVPSEIAKNNAAASYYSAHGAALGAAGGGKPTSRTVMIGGGVDSASGVASPKQAVTIVTKLDKSGAPVVAAYDLSGKPITDQKLLGQAQMVAAQGSGEEGNAPLSAIGADLASARKRYEGGNLSLDDYTKEVATIKLMGGLPKPGGSLNPNAEKPKAALSKEPARTSGQKQFDSAVGKQGYQPFGSIDGVDRYIKNGAQITAPDLAKQLNLEY